MKNLIAILLFVLPNYIYSQIYEVEYINFRKTDVLIRHVSLDINESTSYFKKQLKQAKIDTLQLVDKDYMYFLFGADTVYINPDVYAYYPIPPSYSLDRQFSYVPIIPNFSDSLDFRIKRPVDSEFSCYTLSLLPENRWDYYCGLRNEVNLFLYINEKGELANVLLSNYGVCYDINVRMSLLLKTHLKQWNPAKVKGRNVKSLYSIGFLFY